MTKSTLLGASRGSAPKQHQVKVTQFANMLIGMDCMGELVIKTIIVNKAALITVLQLTITVDALP